MIYLKTKDGKNYVAKSLTLCEGKSNAMKYSMLHDAERDQVQIYELRGVITKIVEEDE